MRLWTHLWLAGALCGVPRVAPAMEDDGIEAMGVAAVVACDRKIDADPARDVRAWRRALAAGRASRLVDHMPLDECRGERELVLGLVALRAGDGDSAAVHLGSCAGVAGSAALRFACWVRLWEATMVARAHIALDTEAYEQAVREVDAAGCSSLPPYERLHCELAIQDR